MGSIVKSVTSPISGVLAPGEKLKQKVKVAESVDWEMGSNCRMRS